jgi:hypothetical protein
MAEKIGLPIRKLLKNSSFYPIMGQIKTRKLLLTWLKTKHNVTVLWYNIMQFSPERCGDATSFSTLPINNGYSKKKKKKKHPRIFIDDFISNFDGESVTSLYGDPDLNPSVIPSIKSPVKTSTLANRLFFNSEHSVCNSVGIYRSKYFVGIYRLNYRWKRFHR